MPPEAFYEFCLGLTPDQITLVMQMQEQYKIEEQKEIDEAEKLAAENEKEGLDENGNFIPDEDDENELEVNGGPGSGPRPGGGKGSKKKSSGGGSSGGGTDNDLGDEQYMTTTNMISRITGKATVIIDPAKTTPKIRSNVEDIVGKKLNMSTSKTNYGTSNYLNITKGEKSLKVRISDHSVTNIDRMNNEVHLFSRRLPNDSVNKQGYSEIESWLKNN
jgi:hypothetical protein